MYHIKLEQFEGHLDLLLQLIEKEKLNISEISLAKIADEFVEYVNGFREENINANELSDFLLLAAQLVLIKSRYLLPFLIMEEDEETGDLEEKLRLYKVFVEAARIINGLYESKNVSFARDRIHLVDGIPLSPFIEGGTNESYSSSSSFLKGDKGGFNSPFCNSGNFTVRCFSPKRLSARDLERSFKELLARIKPEYKLPEERLESPVTVKEKLDELKNLVLKQIQFNFSNMASQGDKAEIIITFLAILELIKQQIVVVEQEEYFGEIVIRGI